MMEGWQDVRRHVDGRIGPGHDSGLEVIDEWRGGLVGEVEVGPLTRGHRNRMGADPLRESGPGGDDANVLARSHLGLEEIVADEQSAWPQLGEPEQQIT